MLENCTIVQFKGKQLSKFSSKVFIDKSIEKKVENVDDLAKQCKIRLNVQNSFVKHPNPSAVHYDSKLDNLNAMHYIGQALSFSVNDDKDKLLCNEICLGSKRI